VTDQCSPQSIAEELAIAHRGCAPRWSASSEVDDASAAALSSFRDWDELMHATRVSALRVALR